MSRTEAQKRADYKSARKIYDQTALRTRKDSCILCRIEIASKRHNISKNAYIIQAVENALKADGLTLDEYKAMAADAFQSDDAGVQGDNITD